MLRNLKLGDMNAPLGNCMVDMNPALVILQNNVTLISTISPVEVKRSRTVRAVEPNRATRGSSTWPESNHHQGRQPE